MNGFGILKRVSFSVSKSSLCNSEVQMFLISVLLSHWYLLEGTKISRVYEFLISRHDWVQVWEQSRNTGYALWHSMPESQTQILGTWTRVFVNHLPFNTVIFLNETLSSVAYGKQVVEFLQATFSYNNNLNGICWIDCHEEDVLFLSFQSLFPKSKNKMMP